jgi:hypothetical protein
MSTAAAAVSPTETNHLLMENLHVQDAVDVMDGSLTDLNIETNTEKHDVDFDAFASDSSLQLRAAIEATPVSHDPTAAPDEPEVEAENDPELVVVVVEETPTETTENLPTLDKTRYVTPKDFELLKVIGMGAFGKVLMAVGFEMKRTNRKHEPCAEL